MAFDKHFSEKERAVLRARAERAARPLIDDRPGDRLMALIIRAGAETYALPVESIIAVHEDMAIIPVPCTPVHVAGIANVRGHILPVLDLPALLGMPAANGLATETAPLVILDGGELSVALRVDEIGSIEPLPAMNPASVPTNLELARPAYLTGISPDGIALLDVKTLLNDPALIVNDAAK